MGRLQYFQIHDVRISYILDVVTIRIRNVSHISFCEIERPRLGGGSEHAHARLTGDKEVPLVAVWVPVDLAHGTRLDCHQSGAEIICDGESGRIDELDGAAGDFVGCLFGPMIGVGDVFRDASVWTGDILSGEVAGCGCAGEDVKFVLGGVFKSGDVCPEIFGQNRFWSAKKELGGEKRVLFGKGAGIKDQKKFGTFAEGLDGVRESSREEPDISCVEIVIGGLAIIIDGSDPCATIKEVLGRRMEIASYPPRPCERLPGVGRCSADARTRLSPVQGDCSSNLAASGGSGSPQHP